MLHVFVDVGGVVCCCYMVVVVVIFYFLLCVVVFDTVGICVWSLCHHCVIKYLRYHLL